MPMHHVYDIIHYLSEIGVDPQKNSMKISGVFDLHIKFRPFENESGFNLNVLLVEGSRLGAVYYAPSLLPEAEKNKISDMNYNGDPTINPVAHLAILDAFFPEVEEFPYKEIQLFGHSRKKSIERATVITETVRKVVGGKKKILMVGFVHAVAKILSNQGHEVYVCDYGIINQKLDGVRKFIHPLRAFDKTKEMDALLVTGMTISTGGALHFLSAAHKSQVPAIFYCETGANLSPWLLKRGARCVIAEEFPYYIMSGLSRIKLFEK